MVTPLQVQPSGSFVDQLQYDLSNFLNCREIHVREVNFVKLDFRENCVGQDGGLFTGRENHNRR